MMPWKSRRWLSVRGQFLLVIVLGMALPIALLGPWLARSARASGEALLRERLDESLAEAANAVGSRWINHRSSLLRIAEDSALLDALREGRPLAPSAAAARTTAVDQTWDALDGVVDALVVRDARGAVRASLARAPGIQTAGAPPGAVLPVQMPVYDPSSGERIGLLEAQLRLSAVLPANVAWSSIGGSVLAIFDETGGAALLPLSMGAELFSTDAFEWAGDDWIVVRRRLREPPMRFALAAPLAPITEPFSQAARRAAIALMVVLTGGLVFSTLLTRRITGPIERLSLAADDVARGRFDQRVSESGADELRRLGHAFNTMTESLRVTLQKLSQREAVAAVGEFAASLAHEVRNPLTAIRLDLERARERVDDPARASELLGRALAEVDRLETTVSGSLRIARSGSLTLSPVDLRRPLQAASAAAEPVFANRCAQLEPWRPPDEALMVHGNAGALEQLFLNLLLNAAEALPPGGSARIAVEESRHDVRVLVRDDGPGIAGELLDRVREPFFTTKENGTGLGLSIGQRIARAHGTELVLESAPGIGTTAWVRLTRESIDGHSPLTES
jgi:signal transduction histidine kinase